MSDDFDPDQSAGRTDDRSPDEQQHDWLTGAWGHRRAAPRFVAPPPGMATGNSVLDPPPPRGRAGARRASQARARRIRRRRGGVVLALVLLLAIGGAVYLGGRTLIGQFTGSEAKDFTGAGVADVVIQVADGDSAGAIGRTLVDDNVVASVGAFTKAASKDSRMASVQPG